MNEKRIMEMLDHPFTLRLEATFQDKDCLYMLLEIVTGGELFDLLADRAPEGVLGTEDAAFYAACVVSAFNHFWEKDVIYRDLKPENLMLDKYGYIKVVDYGFAKVLNGKMVRCVLALHCSGLFLFRTRRFLIFATPLTTHAHAHPAHTRSPYHPVDAHLLRHARILCAGTCSGQGIRETSGYLGHWYSALRDAGWLHTVQC